MRVRLTLAALLMVAPALAAQTPHRIPPRDTCSKDPGFGPVLRHFKNVVARRDAAGLIALTDPGIKNSFGGENGRGEFVSDWKLRGPAARHSRIWAELDTVIRLGCNFYGDGASLPYYFEVDLKDRDAMMTSVVIGTGVALREGPSTTSRVLKRMDWELVSRTGSPQTEVRGWMRVETDDGQIGFIRDDYVRSIVDYRALFARVNGKWVLSAFIAGD